MAEAVQTHRPVAQQTRRGFQINLHEGWIAGVLLGLMLISVTTSVAAANWVDGLMQAMWAALGGMMFGALVTRLRLNGFVALALAVIVGAAWVAWLTSSQVGAPPDATWNEKMLLIQDRIDQWLVHVLSGGIGTDNFVFLCVMCVLAWLVGYTSAWSVFRDHQPWGAILPCGAALLANLFYAQPQSGLYLVTFLLTTLLLLVRTTLLKRQQAWAAYAVRFATDIGLDFLTYGVIFSGLIILLAWLIPPTMPGPAWFSAVYDRVRDPWQSIQNDVSRAFSNVRGTENAAPTTFFSSSLSMGGPIRLGNREVFQIDAAYGRYWRAVIFDKYAGTGWVSSAEESAGFIIGDPRMQTMPMEKRKVITQTVTIRLPTDNLVINASQPVRVYDAVDAKFNVGRTSDNQSYLDIHSIRLEHSVKTGDQYVAVSSISAADEDSLRKASTKIPPYIAEQYLKLPTSVPKRVRDLALQLTAGARNNYDKARAIEQYLRTHITYNDTVDPVPQGWDGVDYVLFERPEGYCNYYASAMAVMARAVGIPARVASGYAVGSASDDGLYHISEANAHSWPEIYLGELGWVEFEPTSSQPEISRPVPEPEQTRPEENPQPRPTDDPFDTERIGDKRLQDLNSDDPNARPGLPNDLITNPVAMTLSAILILGIGGAAVFSFAQWRWKRYLKTLKPGAQAAAELYRLAPLAGLAERGDATPDERAEELTKIMPAAREPIGNVNALYVRERYGGLDLSNDEATNARARALRVQNQMWGAIYDRFIGQNIRAAKEYFSSIPDRIKNVKRE